MNTHWLSADWPAPKNVRTCVTTRLGGHSEGVWRGFNLGDHVGDDPAHVAANRAELEQALGCRPAWLKQVHGVDVCRADPSRVCEADASWTDEAGVACTIMTADCLPALFCTRDGKRVAAAHAGWRGLLDGVLEQTVDTLGGSSDDILVWLGPAIGPTAFEVGAEVRDAFIDADPQAASAFVPSERDGHWLADIYQLARQRLAAAGVQQTYGGGECTFTDAERFYSYRRDGQTGRLASLIWLAE